MAQVTDGDEYKAQDILALAPGDPDPFGDVRNAIAAALAEERERAQGMSGHMWIVGRGQFSDYEVIAVADSREVADQVAKGALGWVGSDAHRYDEDDPQPVPFFTSGDPLPTVSTGWSARADANGVRESEVYEHRHSTIDGPRSPHEWWRHDPLIVTVGDYDTADEARDAALEAFRRAAEETE